MRDFYKALATFEMNLEATYGLSLNETMILCCLREAGEEMTSTALSERTEMTPSNTSKVIGSIEEKGYIHRSLGLKDKRMMYFSLTPKGKEIVSQFIGDNLEVPELLKPLF